MTFLININTSGQSVSPSTPKKKLLPHELSIDDTARSHIRFAPINPVKFSGTGKRTTGSQNECRTSTFYMHLPAPAGQKIALKELQTLPDGNFILAGNILLANTEQEGLLSVMTNAGNIVSQKRIRVANRPTTIFSMKVFLNGQIAVAGIVHDVQDKVFASLLNGDLSTSWVKLFTVPSAPVKVTIDLMENEELGLATQLANSITFSLLSRNGNVIWNRQANPAGLDELVGFSSLQYSEMSLVANCTRGGKKVVEVSRINQADGSVFFSHTIGDGTDENKYFETNTFSNGRITTSGITKKANGQFQLVRDLFYSSANIETEHNYIVPGNIDFAATGATDNAGDALGFCLPQDGKLIFIRHFAYYQTSPEHTRQYNVPIGSGIAAIARSFIDGGYLFGLNTANANELILIKTDSIGTLPGCGYTEISNNYMETINRLNTVSNTVTGDIPLPSQASAISNLASSITSSTDCNQIYCPPPPGDDTCLSSYFKTLRSNSYADPFASYFLMRNNNQLAMTARYDRILGQTHQLTYGFKLFDEKGYYIKGVNFYIDGTSGPVRTRQVDDRHIMLIYTLTRNNIFCFSFTLINDDLQVVWTKTIETFAGYNFFSGGQGFGDFIKDEDGNYFFVGNNLGFGENAKVLACKLDATGNPLWVKVIDIGNAILLSSGVTATSTSLIIICEGSNPGSFSLRLDKSTGQMQNIYQFKNGTSGDVYNRLVQFDKDRVFYSGNNGQSEFTMGLFDTTGLPVKFRNFGQASSITRAATVKSGKLYAMYQYFNGSVYKDVLLKADSTLALDFINEFDVIRFGYPSGLAVSDNGSIYSGGNYSYGGVNGSYYDPYIKKFDPNGSLGTCGFITSTPVISDAVLNIKIPAYTESTRSFTITNDIVLEMVADTSGQRISELLCSSTSNCSSLDITGTGIICQLSKTFTYTASTNPGCTLIPQWLYDTTYAVLLSSTGNTADFRFKNTGNTSIMAKLNAGCSSYIDSFYVEIQNASGSLFLGNDTILCRGDSINLNAGQGFSSYKWQDGSTGSEFIAKQDGEYYVQVNNLCGDIYRDTIRISLAIVPELNLGNDSSVCIADTLRLRANAGFADYSWHPATLVKGQGQQVYAIPVQNEMISLIATTAEGCKAFDTLNITSIDARPVTLGNDTSFCASNSIQLTVASSYLQYLWSTGSTASSIGVNQMGSYWIHAKDINGCIARDTLTVQQVYALPVLNLGDDFDLCEKGQLKLDPGNFTGYLWQDGSTNQSYTVTIPGDYWVTVTDNRGCAASDTVSMKNILPNPANFLKATDSLCIYDKLTIMPFMNYAYYEWSTGSSQQYITVDKPGVYTLRVKDSQGCLGSDSILITQKNDCYSDIYIPTAFTPNGDNLNDIFKARLPGLVVAFRLEVYNRNGEKVFVTTDPQNGWDGIINGTLQPSSVFVWQCFYHLPGAKPSYKKGTVTLIR